MGDKMKEKFDQQDGAEKKRGTRQEETRENQQKRKRRRSRKRSSTGQQTRSEDGDGKGDAAAKASPQKVAREKHPLMGPFYGVIAHMFKTGCYLTETFKNQDAKFLEMQNEIAALKKNPDNPSQVNENSSSTIINGTIADLSAKLKAAEAKIMALEHEVAKNYRVKKILENRLEHLINSQQEHASPKQNPREQNLQDFEKARFALNNMKMEELSVEEISAMVVADVDDGQKNIETQEVAQFDYQKKQKFHDKGHMTDPLNTKEAPTSKDNLNLEKVIGYPSEVSHKLEGHMKPVDEDSVEVLAVSEVFGVKGVVPFEEVQDAEGLPQILEKAIIGIKYSQKECLTLYGATTSKDEVITTGVFDEATTPEDKVMEPRVPEGAVASMDEVMTTDFLTKP